MRHILFAATLLATLGASAALHSAEAHWAWNGYRYVWVRDCGPRCQARHRWLAWHYYHPYAPAPPPYYR
jgi:hypothetical protein